MCSGGPSSQTVAAQNNGLAHSFGGEGERLPGNVAVIQKLSSFLQDLCPNDAYMQELPKTCRPLVDALGGFHKLCCPVLLPLIVRWLSSLFRTNTP